MRHFIYIALTLVLLASCKNEPVPQKQSTPVEPSILTVSATNTPTITNDVSTPDQKDTNNKPIQAAIDMVDTRYITLINSTDEEIVNSFFLIMDNYCDKNATDKLLVSIPNDANLEPSDLIQIINFDGTTTQGTFTSRLNNDNHNCDFIDQENAGFIDPITPVKWNKLKLLLAFRTTQQDKRFMTGSVRSTYFGTEESIQLSVHVPMLEKKYQDDGEFFMVSYGSFINTPYGEQYLHIYFEHATPGTDDRAIGYDGALLINSGDGFTLLEEDTPDILAITDLNGNGVMEVMTKNSNGWGSDYEARLFENGKLSPPIRLLYDWHD